MDDPHAPYFAALEQAVLETPGELAPDVRRAIAAGEAPDGLAPYLDRVRRHAYRVTDAEVEGLKEAGWSDDAVFEATLAAALAAARLRLQRGLAAL